MDAATETFNGQQFSKVVSFKEFFVKDSPKAIESVLKQTGEEVVHALVEQVQHQGYPCAPHEVDLRVEEEYDRETLCYRYLVRARWPRSGNRVHRIPMRPLDTMTMGELVEREHTFRNTAILRTILDEVYPQWRETYVRVEQAQRSTK